jgi:hypothetical protein
MNRTVRILLICIICTSFGGIVALLVSEHTSRLGARAAAPAQPMASLPAAGTGGQPVANQIPTTTITAASPSSPLSSTNLGAAPGNAPAPTGGKPSSFWQLTVAYPTYCTLGTTVQPVLSWNAADTDTVAVSVDSPTTVGGYGFFESIGTLTMPSIACSGATGDALPTHEYEIDAFGTDHTRLHVVLKVDITVSPNLRTPGEPIEANGPQPSDAKQAA